MTASWEPSSPQLVPSWRFELSLPLHKTMDTPSRCCASRPRLPRRTLRTNRAPSPRPKVRTNLNERCARATRGSARSSARSLCRSSRLSCSRGRPCSVSEIARVVIVLLVHVGGTVGGAARGSGLGGFCAPRHLLRQHSRAEVGQRSVCGKNDLQLRASTTVAVLERPLQCPGNRAARI